MERTGREETKRTEEDGSARGMMDSKEVDAGPQLSKPSYASVGIDKISIPVQLPTRKFTS